MAHHAHAVLHTNVNTVDVNAAEAYYAPLDFVRRMRSYSEDTDATALGLSDSVAADTTFIYDDRGPRAAPAIEFVQWLRPLTEDRTSGPTGKALGYAAVGIRRASLDGVAEVLPNTTTGSVWVRGALREAVFSTDTDGVPVEVVQIDPAEGESAGGHYSHVRLRCSDLAATIEWYGLMGWMVKPAATTRTDGVSLVLAEDPTFSLEFEVARDADPAPPAANSRGLYRIALGVEDVVAAHDVLAEAGVSVPEPSFIPMVDTPTGGFTVMVLHDPDGAVVEMVSRPRSEVRRPAQPA